MEERQRRVQLFDAGEFCVNALGEVLRHLNIAAGDGDLGFWGLSVVIYVESHNCNLSLSSRLLYLYCINRELV